jgi:hypothetical protein
MKKPISRVMRTVAALALASGAVIGAEGQSRSGRDYSGRDYSSRSSSSSGATSRPAGYRDRYTILSDQNIFVRERSRIVPESQRNDGSRNDSTTRFTRAVETGFVLTGVVLEEGAYRAYIEDSNASRILRLNLGDIVARGHIVDIDINSIVYEASGQTKLVALGCDLTGAAVVSSGSSGGGGYTGSTGYGGGTPGGSGGAPTPGSTSTSAPSLGVATPPLPVDPNNSNLSLEEKMRLRRALEVKK